MVSGETEGQSSKDLQQFALEQARSCDELPVAYAFAPPDNLHFLVHLNGVQVIAHDATVERTLADTMLRAIHAMTAMPVKVRFKKQLATPSVLHRSSHAK